MTEHPYPTPIITLAWGILYGNPEHRDAGAKALASLILDAPERADGPERATPLARPPHPCGIPPYAQRGGAYR